MIRDSAFCGLCGAFGVEWGVTVYGEFDWVDTRICQDCLVELERPEESTGCRHCESDETGELSHIQFYGDVQAPICTDCVELAKDGASIPTEERAKARAAHREMRISLAEKGVEK